MANDLDPAVTLTNGTETLGYLVVKENEPKVIFTPKYATDGISLVELWCVLDQASGQIARGKILPFPD